MPFIATRDLIAANPVNLIIRDVLQPGETAFDVGAFSGWLTAIMSRLVGPLGTVVAFEADPRNVEECRAYLQQLGASNYTLVHAAVCEKITSIAFYSHKSFGQVSSLTPRSGDDFVAIEVPALSLDSYIQANKLEPRLIKVDIEGSEIRVLEGISDYLRRRSPVLVLEQQPHDKACAEFLQRLGYIGFDTADYRRFNDRVYSPEAAICDIVYFRPSPAGPLHAANFETSKIAVEINSPVMERSADGNTITSRPIPLEPGRYVLESSFTPGAGYGTIRQSVKANGRALANDDGDKQWIWGSYRCVPFHIHQPSAVTLEYVAFDPGALDGLACTGIMVRKFPLLDRPLKINEI
jgi:FkbM family methyltransferase